MKYISKFILITLWGWKIKGEFPEDVKKYIAIAAPHTHWLDFPLGVLFRSVVGKDIKFLAKSSLFKGPFGWFFKWTGGYPIDRSKSNNKVDTIIEVFNNNTELALAISPEGTRQKVDKWKTGFYYIAKGAGIPIIMVTLDFGSKTLKISPPLYPGEDKDKDFDKMYAFYKSSIGKVPEYT